MEIRLKSQALGQQKLCLKVQHWVKHRNLGQALGQPVKIKLKGQALGQNEH